jgi:hypothetical protein
MEVTEKQYPEVRLDAFNGTGLLPEPATEVGSGFTGFQSANYV